MAGVKFRILVWCSRFGQIKDSLDSIKVCYLHNAKKTNAQFSKTGQISEKTIPNWSIQKN